MKPDSGPPSWGRLPEQVAHALRGFEARSVLVGVSGGSDSVALLCLVHLLRVELAIEPEVAYFRHGEDHEFEKASGDLVSGLARRLQLPCWVSDEDAGPAPVSEAGARRARYAWLGRLAVERGAAAVLVGHTLDDQAETILHRILRGTGPRGLKGMSRRRRLVGSTWLLRPLLGIERRELRDFLTETGQTWIDDPTNNDTSRTRARIRHALIPELASRFNPQAARALARLGQTVASELAALDRYVARLSGDCLLDCASPDRAELDAGYLCELRLGDRTLLLRTIWEKKGWPMRAMSRAAWRRLGRYAKEGEGVLALPRGFAAQRLGGRFVVGRRSALSTTTVELEPPVTPISCPGSVRVGPHRLEVAFDPDPAEGWSEIVDADRLAFLPTGESSQSLLVRPWRPGDRFAPLGLDGHSRAVADLLRSRGVLAADRSQVALLCDEAGIVWVAGHRIADRVKCTEATTRRLGLRLRLTESDR